MMHLPHVADALLRMALFSSLFLALAHAAAFLLRKQSAAIRHQAWTAALFAAVLLPLASLIPARLAWIPPVTSGSVSAPVLAESAQVPESAEVLPSTLVAATTAMMVSEPADIAFVSYDHLESGAAAAPASASTPWPSIGAWLWIIGSAILLIRLAVIAMAAQRTVRGAAPAGDAQSKRFRGLAERMGAPTETKLMVTNALGGPCTAGIVSPVVVAPAAKDWHRSVEGEIALLHELGHVKRRDVASQFIGLMASALYWWNPLVWSATRNQRREAELACDDAVLLTGTNPEDYAGSLLSAARRFSGSPRALQLAMASPHGIEGRIDAVLDDEVCRRPFSPWARACAWSTMGLLTIFGGTLARATESAAESLPGPLSEPAAETAPMAVAVVPAQPNAVVASQEADSIDSLRKEVAADPGNPKFVKKLASALARAGENKEALELMLWCFDHGEDPPHQSFSGVRVSFLLGDLQELAKTYPPARAAMVERRDSAKKIVLSQRPTSTATRNLVRLNATLGDASMNLAVYEQLVTNSDKASVAEKPPLLKSRAQLFQEVVPVLLEAKRYDEVVAEFGDPVDWLKRKQRLVKMVQLSAKTRKQASDTAADYMLSRTIKDGGYLYQALVGARKHDIVAAEFAKGLVEVSPALNTWKTLVESAKATEREDLVKSLRADAQEALPEAEFARLDFKRK